MYNNYSTATGDVQNSNSFANNKSLFAHASTVTDAAKQADGTTPDDRLGRKVVKLGTPVSPPQGIGIPAEYTFSIYPSNSSDVPIIRNEELILLRAEANIFLNNTAAALVVNTTRTVWVSSLRSRRSARSNRHCRRCCTSAGIRFCSRAALERLPSVRHP